MNSLLALTISARYLKRNAGPRTYWLLYNGCLVKVTGLWRCFNTNKSLNFNHDSRLSRLKQEPLHTILNVDTSLCNFTEVSWRQNLAEVCCTVVLIPLSIRFYFNSSHMDYLPLCDSEFNYIIWWERTVSALQMALTLHFTQSCLSARLLS